MMENALTLKQGEYFNSAATGEVHINLDQITFITHRDTYVDAKRKECGVLHFTDGSHLEVTVQIVETILGKLKEIHSKPKKGKKSEE